MCVWILDLEGVNYRERLKVVCVCGFVCTEKVRWSFVPLIRYVPYHMYVCRTPVDSSVGCFACRGVLVLFVASRIFMLKYARSKKNYSVLYDMI